MTAAPACYAALVDWETIAALAALLALQSFWIGRALDGLGERISELDRRLSERISELEARLSERISDLDTRLSERIERLDDRLTSRLDGLDERLRGLERERS